MSFKELTNELSDWFENNIVLEQGSHLPMNGMYELYVRDTAKAHGSERLPNVIKRKTFANLFKNRYRDSIESEAIRIHYAGRSTVLGVKMRVRDGVSGP